MITCLNCRHSFEGKFCPNCGQSAEIKRLTWHSLVHQTVHFFMHIEKGFLYTIWSFFVQPGKAAFNYLKGKRRQYQPPVSYILILTGIYIIVHNFIIAHYHLHYSLSTTGSVVDFRERSNIMLRTHFTPFILLIIMVSAVVIYKILGTKNFNFIEIEIR